MNIKLFKEFNKYLNVFEEDENEREINVYNFKNCVPCGHNLYYPNVLLNSKDNGLILPVLERTMSLNIGTIYENNNMKYEYIDQIITNNNKCPLFFFIYNTDTYFHFLYDTLPYLITFFKLKQSIFDLKLLMQFPNKQRNKLYPFVLEFLEILNINQDDLVFVDNHTSYDNIYISTSYTHDINSNAPPRKEIYLFYQNMTNYVLNNYNLNIIIPKKIYVSRRTWKHNDFTNIGTNYTTRRKLINEDALVEKLINEGYQEVFTEKLTTIEKILYFSNASHVVGAIGGGISNVLFSPNSTVLEAIISPTFLLVNMRFKYSIECVNVHYNHNTTHIEKGEFKTYMRVKTKDNKIIGEIEQIYDNKLLVSYNDGSNTGWNSQNIFNKIELDIKDVDKLDDGLNSCWELIIL
jgi:hypothetical protein